MVLPSTRGAASKSCCAVLALAAVALSAAVATALSACDPGGAAAGAECAGFGLNGECVSAAPIRLNTVGYLPESPKRATVVAEGDSFRVLDAETQDVVFEGDLGPSVDSPDTGETVRVADFSDLRDPGSYVLAVSDYQSKPFVIDADVYRGVLNVLMLGLYGQRCGTEVSLRVGSTTFSHARCHSRDAALNYAFDPPDPDATGTKDSVGGWHDAGDYGKYTVNGAFSVGMMLDAWQQFEPQLLEERVDGADYEGDLPDFLQEIKWEIEWLLTVQFEDGSASHKVTALQFSGLNTMPERDNSSRFFAPATASATGSLAGSLALAARVFADYDEDLAARCRDAALLSYEYLSENYDRPDPDLSRFETGGYRSSGRDDRLWATAEVWELTGDEDVLSDLEEQLENFGDPVHTYFDWGDVGNLGSFTYALSDRPGRDPDLVERLQQRIVAAADEISDESERHPHGRGVGVNYWWGINGTVARTTMNLQAAYRLTADPRYLDAWVSQLDHLLGRNYYGRSQVTGLGWFPPENPHHRPSVADGVSPPWPGLLVGGSHSDNSPPATGWNDSSSDYETNEVAINWNTAMIYAAAGLLPGAHENGS